ncbi:winged helix-turn-helix transcriptional regulator [Clostridium sediminicola]|uniref:winged helix-turn-helix transcriptional regulator n=1 Tax=Clostridium sediminicola TaxID=3114879 RepID=UPI003D182C7A
MRDDELKRAIPNISHKVLASELRNLEEDGLIIREAYPTIPPKVEYSTSGLGESLRPILQQMCDWSKKYMK